MHFDRTDGKRLVSGYILGFSRPTFMKSIGESTYGSLIGHDVQMSFQRWGGAAGVKLNPLKHKNFSVNSILRYAVANSAMLYRDYVDINLTGIDQKQWSLNSYFEWHIDARHPKSTGPPKGPLRAQFYAGLGFKLFYSTTEYHYKDPEAIERRYLDLDNGFDILPTVHFGLRLGVEAWK